MNAFSIGTGQHFQYFHNAIHFFLLIFQLKHDSSHINEFRLLPLLTTSSGQEYTLLIVIVIRMNTRCSTLLLGSLIAY